MLFSLRAQQIVVWLRLVVFPFAFIAVVTCWPANSSATAGFLGAVKHDGVDLGRDSRTLVAQARWACRRLDQGESPADAAAWLLQAGPTPDTAHEVDGVVLLRDGAHWFCPARR